MALSFVQAFAGLVLLIFAGDVLVRGSVQLAERLGISPLIIGMTIVACGTSAPELLVGVEAVLFGAPRLALGNVVGSNIANVLLVVGLPALIAPMTCQAPRLVRNLSVMLAITVVFIAIAHTGRFAWWDGLVLLALLVAFIWWNIRAGRRDPRVVEALVDMDEIEEASSAPLAWSILLVAGGLAGLAFGADLLVEGSVTIAETLGVPEAVIGLTMVAIGTSLPELITAIMAAVRCQCDVAIGNVIGSNIFNLLAIIGVASLFGDVPVPSIFLKFDLWLMLAASLALVPFCVARRAVGRWSGLLLLLAYAGYMVWLATGDVDAYFNGVA
ncbi:cation:H+ antiporter [Rhodothalassium salexigens DSM 2132]|uniref:Cation:H+ antiporter n=1 Tax=Rhodothalassium salexigens DSM 2132 TaxID=1188247 RepID=A0A4R2PFX0_RHOSA|nr:calcium/sodium antiporter [Rhodothalassium salexigens]MBB4211952.1 cation:H+ antiporter [Rhodothalassium salexigens DSM 2132]MBK1638614.1 sodium:proton exchanger [Rhodothalassium salexigens DSM 2132]TCP33464.1 cation:H+ antiporter [Rhodothalassium salexigens DSM 2132]